MSNEKTAAPEVQAPEATPVINPSEVQGNGAERRGKPKPVKMSNGTKRVTF